MTQFYSLSKNKCYWRCIFPEWHLVFCSSQLTGLSKLLTWKNHRMRCDASLTLPNNQQRTMPTASPPKCCIACLTSVSPLGGNMVGKGHWTSSLVCSPQGLALCRKAKWMMVELIKELIMELTFSPMIISQYDHAITTICNSSQNFVSFFQISAVFYNIVCPERGFWLVI